MPADFTPTTRSRARRRPQRAAYDEVSVYAVLDAGILGHVGYQIDGQPFVTPTVYWRKERQIYWHGAAASRMLRAVDDAPVCLTVSHLDGLVVGRSAFAHSINYRSVMAFGRARRIDDPQVKRAAMDAFLERLYPGSTVVVRPANEGELAQIAVVEMTIEEASAKVRSGGVANYAPDAGWPAWAGVIPLETCLVAPIPDGPSPFGPPRVALVVEPKVTFPV